MKGGHRRWQGGKPLRDLEQTIPKETGVARTLEKYSPHSLMLNVEIDPATPANNFLHAAQKPDPKSLSVNDVEG